MKKRMATIALLMTAVMGLSACGSSGGSGSDSGGEASGGDSGEGIELVVSHYYLEEERDSNASGDTFLTMVEQYEEEHPDVTVTQQTMSQADFTTKIQAQAAANELPDVFMVKGSWVQNFVDNGVLAPMDDYLAEYEYTDTFRSDAFDASTVDGKIYGIPNQLSMTSVVYYNAELWAEAGYDEFPTTWDDLFAANEKFKEMGISTFSLGNKDKWPAESCIISTIGDRYTGSDWTNSIIANDGNAKFTDQEFIDALNLFKEMSDSGMFNADCNTITDTQAAEYYAQGQAAATVSGHWEIATLQSLADEELLANTKVALLPTNDGSEPTSFSGGCGWYFGVNANLTGEKLDAAMEFVLATSGYDASVYTAETYGLPSGNVVSDVDLSGFSQLTQDFVELVNSVSLTPTYDLQMDGAVIEVMNTGLQDILNGTKDAETVAAEIQAEQDKL
ncbi:extracellular solute-binding protein [Ruminococcus sp. CLA-AA-H200]|uniref:Extracellular solute-binding protein n=1 Tax=Ruminococcus turbiniformis TaxID=2881258 RepID=A0ABS8G0B6_9FIRM|nr:extracellular solute-binding protein [Ruminococcus turbiniformis]MCC2255755.1 extracellular solute-binding protein [Ruminococcus turbiniformis]